MGRYSKDVEEDKLISDLMRSYGFNARPRGLCIERDWSEDGEGIISARPYTRVRSVKIYNSAEWLKADMPKNLAPFECGTRMEAW